jgi:hypothetical protein
MRTGYGFRVLEMGEQVLREITLPLCLARILVTNVMD